MSHRVIYCAGPLFNAAERGEMAKIAAGLENAGYKTFLPQRDGLELASMNKTFVRAGYTLEEANRLLQRAVFELDTAQVVNADGLLLNMNGRVPDEGAMVEAGIAWALGKPIVIFKADSRSTFDGVDNPLVVGMADFEVVVDIGLIPKKFDQLGLGKSRSISATTIVSAAIRTDRGNRLRSLLESSSAAAFNVEEFVFALNK